MQKFTKETVSGALAASRMLLLLAFVAALAPTACSKPVPQVTGSSGCGGRLVGQIYAGMNAELNWDAGRIECADLRFPGQLSWEQPQ